jgi:exosortase N
VYVVLPLWYILKLLPYKSVEYSGKTNSKSNNLVFVSLVFTLLIMFSLFRFTSLGAKQVHSNEKLPVNYISSDFTCTVEEHNVLKLVNEDFLIYVKPAASFYSADHSPIICWKGSGYKVVKEQIIEAGNKKVYYSELKKGNDILHSTWWYDSGEDKTISQLKWRFNNLLNGDKNRLINVISNNRTDLIAESRLLLNKNIFND